MKKLVASVVALSSIIAIAADETNVGKSLESGFSMTSFESSTESFSSGDFSFGSSSNFLLGDRDAYEGAPMVVPIGYLVKPALPTNVPSSITPTVFGSCEFGQKRRSSFAIMYAIFAKGLADFDTDEVEIDAITTAKGKDLSRQKNGQAAWEIERFGGMRFRDQGYATFTLKCIGEVLPEPMPKVKGRVSFSVADKMVTKDFSGKVSAGRIGEDELVWKVKKAKSMWGENGEQKLVVSPQGDKAQNVTIEIFAGDEKLNSSGNMSVGGKVEQLYFKAPAADDIVIKAKYPDGTRKVTLEL